MKFTIPVLLCLCVWLSVDDSQAKGWRGIVPLHSTRTDVEQLIGKPNFQYGLYDLENERVSITYSKGTCAEGAQWDVPCDVVTQISVTPKGKLRLADLHLDPSKYKRIKDPEVQVHTFYSNKEDGIRYVVFEGGGEDNGLVLNIYYEPGVKDEHLRCADAGRQLVKQ